MERCVHFEVIDKSVGNDAFDHPTYGYYCHKKNKDMLSERPCRTCECHQKPIIHRKEKEE